MQPHLNMLSNHVTFRLRCLLTRTLLRVSRFKRAVLSEPSLQAKGGFLVISKAKNQEQKAGTRFYHVKHLNKKLLYAISATSTAAQSTLLALNESTKPSLPLVVVSWKHQFAEGILHSKTQVYQIFVLLQWGIRFNDADPPSAFQHRTRRGRPPHLPRCWRQVALRGCRRCLGRHGNKVAVSRPRRRR